MGRSDVSNRGIMGWTSARNMSYVQSVDHMTYFKGGGSCNVVAPPDHPNHHPQKFEDIVRGNISRKTISTFAKRIFVPTERLKEDHGTINLDTFQRRDMWAAERTRPPSRGGIHRHGRRGKRFGVTSRCERENWTNGGTRASGAATEDGRRKRRK